jgi:hypothetical protein
MLQVVSWHAPFFVLEKLSGPRKGRLIFHFTGISSPSLEKPYLLETIVCVG